RGEIFFRDGPFRTTMARGATEAGYDQSRLLKQRLALPRKRTVRTNRRATGPNVLRYPGRNRILGRVTAGALHGEKIRYRRRHGERQPSTRRGEICARHPG